MANVFFLPDWIVVDQKFKNDEKLNPLEQFVYDNEPAGNTGDEWRRQLSDALEWLQK